MHEARAQRAQHAAGRGVVGVVRVARVQVDEQQPALRQARARVVDRDAVLRIDSIRLRPLDINVATVVARGHRCGLGLVGGVRVATHPTSQLFRAMRCPRRCRLA